MRESKNKTAFEIEPNACILFAIVILLLPLPWCVTWLIATVAHEAGHYIALRYLKVSVYAVSVKCNGVLMETGDMTKKVELFSALAGPVCGLLLVLCVKLFPRLAICACIQSVYNLLPIYPLDGGRVLFAILSSVMRVSLAQRICILTEYMIFGFAVMAALYASIVLRLGALPLLAVSVLLFRKLQLKIPCKEGKLRVQ